MYIGYMQPFILLQLQIYFILWDHFVVQGRNCNVLTLNLLRLLLMYRVLNYLMILNLRNNFRIQHILGKCIESGDTTIINSRQNLFFNTFFCYILVKLLKKNVILLSQYTHNNKNECVIILHGGLR